MELPSNTLGPTWYLIAIIVIASGGTIGTLYGNIHQYFIQPPQPKISLEILFDNISNSSIFLLTNNGFAPAKNLLFTIMLENISKKNIFSSENYTLIQDDPTMLKLYFPRFSFGYGSIAEVKTFHNTRLNLLKENYSSYVTYEQGSLKINTSIQTPKKVTSVTNPILNIILLIILTFILLIPAYILIKLWLCFRKREHLKKDAIISFISAIIFIFIYLYFLFLSINELK